MDTWNNDIPAADYRYFNGADSFLDSAYLRKKLKKKRFRLEYEKGELIAAAGEKVEDCFFIDSGSVMVCESQKGKRRIIDCCTAGSFLMCEHILYEHPAACCYEVKEKTAVYSISIVKVRQLLNTDQKFMHAVFAQQTRNLLVLEDLFRKTITHNASWLVSDFLITMAIRGGQKVNGIIYLGERMTQKQIADMLYMNRVTCFRELHTLEDLGFVDMQTSRIGIRNMEGLIAYREKCEEDY